MNKALLLLASACTAATLLAASCGKSYNATPAISKSQLFADLKPEAQAFTVQAGTESTISGTGGTRINFYPNSFKDAAGNVITSGTVQVEMKEMYSTGAMIRNGATTMSGGRILQSGGQINMTATVNGNKVYSNGYGVSFKQNGPSTVPMHLFYGNKNNNDSIVTWGGIDTTHLGNAAPYTVIDPATGEEAYIFDSCTDFGWTNCDQYYEYRFATYSCECYIA